MKTAEWKTALLVVGGFLACFFLPVGIVRFDAAIMEALHLVRWYAREHVLLCLIPAFFIAGAMAVFVSRTAVMKYLGARAHKVLAYCVASISGTLLAVCSCTVLALFAGIYRMGAGLGPAVTFLYSGPAINVLAIILTARVLGLEMGIARAVAAILFSIVIGLLMHLIHRNDGRAEAGGEDSAEAGPHRPLWKNAAFFAAMVGVLVLANWAKTGDVRAVFLCCPGGLTTLSVEGTIVEEADDAVRLAATDGQEHVIPRDLVHSIEARKPNSAQQTIYRIRWMLVAGLLVILSVMIAAWFKPAERADWMSRTWGFTKQILPLLLLGVLGAGFFLGRPGREGIIPTRIVEMLVGGSPAMLLDATGIEGGPLAAVLQRLWPLWSNLFASVVGAFMYFATLTEVPILQGLMGSGMSKGPALALLLAGPALSLPNMLVIHSVLGPRKTLTFISLVIVLATIAGMLFGWMR